MTIDTPIESPCGVYSKHVVTKIIYFGIWPKNPKNFPKMRLFCSFLPILFMVAIYSGVFRPFLVILVHIIKYG
jgi:hypothetical protein